METTNETIVPEHYNPNQLVTYKVISDGTTTYPTTKVTDIEWALESYRTMKERSAMQSQRIGQLEERLSDYLEMDSEEIVSDICSIFGFNPTKDIEFEANVTITGTVTVPLTELSTFDINDIDLDISVDAYSYSIDDYNVEVDSITTL